jgi:endonuclease/exonuclease/phosphatase (EEP) superfamily protein YafD
VGGERLGVPGALLYLPPLIWTLPFAVMTVAALCLRSRIAVLHIAGIAFVAFGYADFRWAWRVPEAKGDELKVITNNVGQNNHRTLGNFMGSEKPDIVVLQEAPARGRNYALQYPEMHVAGQGEFVLISRLQINRAKLVREISWRGRPVAARFEVEYKGRPLAVYGVHMPTPRNDLLRLWGRGFAEEILDPSSVAGSSGRVPVGLSMRERVKLARRLVSVLQAEDMPFIVVGDFNMPSNGYIRRIFSGQLRDAFGECGRGYGFTFPGYTRNPLSFFKPWLRLDYLFAGKGLKPSYIRTEPGRPSQHRAVAAGFAFEEAVK